MRVNKGQILALTIFFLFASLGIVLVLLMSLNQQLIRIRKLLNTFQALSNAESGLEIGNLYSLKNIRIDNFNYSQSTSTVNEICNIYYTYACQQGGRNICQAPFVSSCWKYKINNQNNSMNIELYIALVYKSEEVYSFFIKNISQGNYKDLNRILDFDFLP